MWIDILFSTQYFYSLVDEMQPHSNSKYIMVEAMCTPYEQIVRAQKHILSMRAKDERFRVLWIHFRVQMSAEKGVKN